MPALAIFGDSIVHGGADGGWPMRIRRRLVEAGLGDHAYIRGMPGDTSFNLLARIGDELRHLAVETVVVCIGTNDAQCLRDRAHPRTTNAEYGANLREIVGIAKRRARWVVLVDPPEAIDGSRAGDAVRFWSAERLRALRAVLAGVAAESACWHVRLDGIPAAAELGDGVHPSPAGHDAIADRVWRGLAASGALGAAAAGMPGPA